MGRNEWFAAALVVICVVLLAVLIASIPAQAQVKGDVVGSGWDSWRWVMLALGIGTLGAVGIALFLGRRPLREMDTQLKATFTAPDGQDWGKVTGTFVGGKLVSVETVMPLRTVNVDIGRPCRKTFYIRTFDPNTRRSESANLTFGNFFHEDMHTIYGANYPLNEANPVGIKGSGTQGSTIDKGPGTVPPLTVRNKKKSDSLLGHQITGSREGEERQAANEQQSKTGQGGYCLGGVTQQKDTYVASGGQNATTIGR